jgi:HdeA/HdeB family
MLRLESKASANWNSIKFAAVAGAMAALAGCADVLPPPVATPSDTSRADTACTADRKSPYGKTDHHRKTDHRVIISSRPNPVVGNKAAAFATAKVDAQKIDVSAMTCRQFVQDETNSQVILAWFLGFYSEVQNPQVIDLGKLQNFREKLLTFCKEEHEFRMTTAAEGILGK